jgi:hypothetical protein
MLSISLHQVRGRGRVEAHSWVQRCARCQWRLPFLTQRVCQKMDASPEPYALIRRLSWARFVDGSHPGATGDQRQGFFVKRGKRRAVCDADIGGVGKTAADEPIEMLFYVFVEGGGRFVQEQPVWLVQQWTGERPTLRLLPRRWPP